MEDNNIIIQLGEISKKEAKEKPIPTGEKYSISKYGKPELDSIPIYVHQNAFLKIENHIKANINIEMGGVLLGEFCKEKESHFLEIVSSISASHTKSSSTKVKFTHDTWEAIFDEFETLKKSVDLSVDLSIVGWYHTHPGLGVFLSGYDVFIQKNFFNEIWQVALVIDPIQNERKFFRLIEDKIVACGFYYLESPVKILGDPGEKVDVKV